MQSMLNLGLVQVVSICTLVYAFLNTAFTLFMEVKLILFDGHGWDGNNSGVCRGHHSTAAQCRWTDCYLVAMETHATGSQSFTFCKRGLTVTDLRWATFGKCRQILTGVLVYLNCRRSCDKSRYGWKTIVKNDWSTGLRAPAHVVYWFKLLTVYCHFF
jgi:hypothetical protein